MGGNMYFDNMGGHYFDNMGHYFDNMGGTFFSNIPPAPPEVACPEACVSAFNDWDHLSAKYFSVMDICSASAMVTMYHSKIEYEMCKDCAPCMKCSDDPMQGTCYNYMRTNGVEDLACFNSACGYDYWDALTMNSASVGAEYLDPGTTEFERTVMHYGLLTGGSENGVCPMTAQS